MSKSLRFSVIWKEALIEVAASGEFTGCITWPFSKSHNGYAQTKWQGKMQRVNRVVCEMAHGPAPKGKPLALHKCGNAGCISADCLRWGDHFDNFEDRDRHGTTANGEANGKAKLTADEVCEIRSLYETGLHSMASIGEAYGVSSGAINAVLKGRTWRHVECEADNG